MYQPLILVPTTHDVRLLMRSSDNYLTLTPEALASLKAQLAAGERVGEKLSHLAYRQWGLDISGLPLGQALHIREPTQFQYENASWELNLRCDYDCEHCYLGPKPPDSLPLEERIKVLETMSDLGVYRLQITGGEPLIDRLFAESYIAAYRMGMLIRVSTNASQLHRQRILDVLTEYPPLHLTISLYGAKAEAYEALTRTPPGTFNKYLRGLRAAAEAGIKLRINIIVTKHNDTQVAEMEELARSFGAECHVYGRLTATYHGTGEVLDSQSTRVELRKKRQPFTGCNAGTTFFHVDPRGRASICKIGREPYVQINERGAEGMKELVGIAEGLLKRSSECAPCGSQSTCSTCPPMVADYRKANAPTAFYCQH